VTFGKKGGKRGGETILSANLMARKDRKTGPPSEIAELTGVKREKKKNRSDPETGKTGKPIGATY